MGPGSNPALFSSVTSKLQDAQKKKKFFSLVFLAFYFLLFEGTFTYRGLYIEKYHGLMGKKYHENNARADKKGEKERKDKGKEKIIDKKTEQEQCFIKLWVFGNCFSQLPRLH